MLGVSPARAQSGPTPDFATGDGLPDAPANVVAQIGPQALVVGTDQGLRKLRASRFVSLSSAQVEIEDGQVNDVAATGDDLWVATDGGLYRRDSTGAWDREAGPTGRVKVLRPLGDDALLVGTSEGLWRRDSGGLWQQILDRANIDALAPDQAGRIWVAAAARILVLDAGELALTIDAKSGLPPRESVTDLLLAPNGDMLAGTSCVGGERCGLVRIDPSGSVEEVRGFVVSGTRFGVTTLTEGPEGHLWVGLGGGGVMELTGTRTIPYTAANGLIDNRVRDLAFDTEGNLWVATRVGVTRLPVGTWRAERDPAVRGIVTSIATGVAGTDYVGTTGGFFRRTPGGDWESDLVGLPSTVVRDLVGDRDGQVWVGTDAGLVVSSGARFVPTEHTQLNDVPIRDLHLAADGSLWVGTDAGAYHLTGHGLEEVSADNGQLGQDIANAIWETRSGDMWIATLNGGVSQLHNGEWRIWKRGEGGVMLADNIVLDVLEDDAGNLWFATFGGVSRLTAGHTMDDEAGWTQFAAGALATDRANVLLQDRQREGHLWVGTEGGLTLIVDDEISISSPDDGLTDRDVRALAQDDAGRLWIGTASGVTYHADLGRRPVIEAITVTWNGQTCSGTCSIDELPYDTDRLSFEFASTDLGDLTGVSYQWTLANEATGEIVASGDTIAGQASATGTISVEPGGSYRLTVTAIDRDFNAAETEAAVGVLPLPMFHPERAYFWPAVGALVVLLLAVALNRERISFALRSEKYLDAVLELSPTAGGYTAKLDTSGSPVERHITPNVAKLQAQDAALRSGGSATGTLETLGQNLYASFIGLLGDELFQRAGGELIRIRLRVPEDGPLSSLPWEMMHGGNDLGHLAIDSSVSIVRDLSRIGGDGFRRPPPKLKVLIAWSDPADMPVDRIEDEVELLRSALDRASGRIELLDTLEHANVATLPGCLLTEGCDILHFLGHGGEEDSRGVIYIEDGRGDALPLSADELRPMLSPVRSIPRPTLIILTACRTAGAASGVASLAEELVLKTEVPAVVGMGYDISPESAQAFSQGFYSALSEHGQVDYAVSSGRAALVSELTPDALDWAIPRLYTRARNGVIFKRGW